MFVVRNSSARRSRVAISEPRRLRFSKSLCVDVIWKSLWKHGSVSRIKFDTAADMLCVGTKWVVQHGQQHIEFESL
jgi:hypothetical protein